MKHWRALSVIFLVLAFSCLGQQGAPWEVFGTGPQSEFQSIGDTNIFNHGAVVSNQTAVITMENGTADQLTGEVVAQGDVTILDHGHVFRGTNFIYNFKTGDVRSGLFKTLQGPFDVTGTQMSGTTTNGYKITNGVFTTDGYATPDYTIRAKRINIVIGKYFEAYDAWLYIGEHRIFYFPYYHKQLGPHPNNFEFVPGYRSIFGPYLLSAYNWYGTGLVDGTIHLDEREARGVAAGPDLQFHLGEAGEAAFRYYYINDQHPNDDDLNAPHLSENRQRASFFYEVNRGSNFTAKVVGNYQSDPLVIRDFFESEYNADVEPNSFAEAEQLGRNYTVDMVVQPRLVNFFETVERLPDVKLSGLRQQVGETPFYYESESSIGYFKRAFSDTNTLYYLTNYSLAPNGLDFFPMKSGAGDPPSYAATRVDTFHQITLPETFFNWLNVVPRVGGRLTYYSDVDGPQIHTNEQLRAVFNTGMEVSTKASRIYRDVENDFLDVHDLRHIIEPSIDYVYVPAPSRSASELPQFDYQQPSLRLSPIDFPDNNSIDSIGYMNVMRFTLINKLQTKRRDGIEDMINWAVYADWHLNPRTNESTFSDLYSDLDFRPRSWLTFNSSTRYDIADGHFREAIERVVVLPSPQMNLSVTYDYLINNDPEFQNYYGQNIPGHNLVDVSLYYRMNENWGAHIAERFEGQDGVLQEQLYSIYRDLRSWTAAMTFRVTEGPGQPTDFTVALTFSLKAFPRYNVNSDSDRPALLLGSASSVDPRSPY